MPRSHQGTGLILVAGLVALGLTALPSVVRGHCDTLGGPVVKDGRAALESGDIRPALKWIKTDHEAELRKAFDRARSVRAKGPESRELADLYFLETLVRLHRAGEGAPFSGLKDEPLEPIVAQSDKALADGSDKDLIQALNNHMASAIREKFARAFQAMKGKEGSVAAGREFVEAYVVYTHFVEAIHTAIAGAAGGPHGAAPAAVGGHRH